MKLPFVVRFVVLVLISRLIFGEGVPCGALLASPNSGQLSQALFIDQALAVQSNISAETPISRLGEAGHLRGEVRLLLLADDDSPFVKAFRILGVCAAAFKRKFLAREIRLSSTVGPPPPVPARVLELIDGLLRGDVSSEQTLTNEFHYRIYPIAHDLQEPPFKRGSSQGEMLRLWARELGFGKVRVKIRRSIVERRTKPGEDFIRHTANELAKNVIDHAHQPGVLLIRQVPGGVEMIARDLGLGIKNLQQAMKKGFSTAPRIRVWGKGKGVGLHYVRDEFVGYGFGNFSIESKGNGLWATSLNRFSEFPSSIKEGTLVYGIRHLSSSEMAAAPKPQSVAPKSVSTDSEELEILWQEIFLPILNVAKAFREGELPGTGFPIYPPLAQRIEISQAKFLSRFAIYALPGSSFLLNVFEGIVREMLGEFFRLCGRGTIDAVERAFLSAEMHGRAVLSRELNKWKSPAEPVATSRFTERALVAAQDPFDAPKFLDELMADPELKALFGMPAGVWDGKPSPYSLRRHVLDVLRQFEKYFGDARLPAGMSKPFFRLLLALHDIGKPLTAGQFDTREQHRHTREIISKIVSRYEFPHRDLDLIAKLVDGDPLGSYFIHMQQGRNFEELILETMAELERMNEGLGLSLHGFFRILTVYYQSDIASYTLEGGFHKDVLAFLLTRDSTASPFVFDEKAGRLLFADDERGPFETAYRRLEEAVRRSNTKGWMLINGAPQPVDIREDPFHDGHFQASYPTPNGGTAWILNVAPHKFSIAGPGDVVMSPRGNFYQVTGLKEASLDPERPLLCIARPLSTDMRPEKSAAQGGEVTVTISSARIQKEGWKKVSVTPPDAAPGLSREHEKTLRESP